MLTGATVACSYDVLTDKKERVEIRKKGAKSTFRAKFNKKKERINPGKQCL